VTHRAVRGSCASSSTHRTAPSILGADTIVKGDLCSRVRNGLGRLVYLPGDR